MLSDSEDDEQASQLFSQHVESSSLMAPYDQLKIKNEVTENYEVRMNEYDDEDRPIEDSNFGMFEEHFIHCSQEISLLESTKSLETNSSTSQSADKNSFIMKANSIREGIDDCNDVFIEDGSSSAVHISSDDLQKKQETIDCEKTLTKDDTLKMTDSEFPTKIREVKHLSKRKPRQKKSSKEQDTSLPKDTKSLLEKSCLKAKEEKAKTNNRISIEKENKMIYTEKDDKQVKGVEIERNNKSADSIILGLKITKSVTADVANNTVAGDKVRRPLNKSKLNAKTIREKMESKKKGTKAREKETESTFRRRSDLEKLRKERNEKLKMIALRAKEKAKGALEDNEQQNGQKLKSLSINTETSIIAKNPDETNKPILNDTVRVSNRTKPVSVTLVKLPEKCVLAKLKDVKEAKIDSQKRLTRSDSNKLVRSVEERANSLQDSTAASNTNEQLNQVQTPLADKIKKLKMWEQNIIKNFNECSLNSTTNDNSIPVKRKPTVQFKTDLVEIRTYICEGNFTRKVSDKENRVRREIPPQTPLMDYSWRGSLKTNYVLYDICKWNVTWLEVNANLCLVTKSYI